jgi:hypothetical protein
MDEDLLTTSVSEMVDDVYGVRCVLRHATAGTTSTHPCFEERITLWRADSIADAMALAAAEGRDYAATVHAEWCDVVQAFSLTDNPRFQGAEVFSLMRDSDLPIEDYVAGFFDTGSERTRHSS